MAILFPPEFVKIHNVIHLHPLLLFVHLGNMSNISFRWLSATLWYLQCISNRDIAVLLKAIDLFLQYPWSKVNPTGIQTFCVGPIYVCVSVKLVKLH